MKYHVPVLLKPSVDALNIKPDGIYVDLTFGGGGHSAEILSRLTTGKLFSFDQDRDAMANIKEDNRFCFVQSNFRFVTNFLRFYDALPVDGIIADLGISSWQIDEESRGFSFRYDAPLDMRMNRDSGFTAADILKTYTRQELTRIFRDYGEVKSASFVAQRIVKEREDNPINTTGEFVKLVDNMVPANKKNRFLAQLFQALRIEVNKEMEALEEMLVQIEHILKPGGRIVVMAYHSLEDRLVKNLMRSGNLDGKIEKDFYGNVITPFKQITRKPVIADADEIALNPRARSVRLRIAELKEYGEETKG